MKRYITCNNEGIWQVRHELKTILLECKGDYSTRFLLDGINIKHRKEKEVGSKKEEIQKSSIAATDGRRLVEITCHIPPTLPEGRYFVTPGGYLFATDHERKFPDYESLFIPKKKRKILLSTDHCIEGDHLIGLVFGALYTIKFPFSYSLYKKAIEILAKTISGNLTLTVSKENPTQSPMIIEADVLFGGMRYIQMPISNQSEKVKIAEKD